MTDQDKARIAKVQEIVSRLKASRPPDRNPAAVIEALRRAHEKYPDMRVGQLIENATYANTDPAYDVELYFLENDKLAAAILEFAGLTEEKP